MRDHFFTSIDGLRPLLRGEEVLTASFHGERSDFVRFNRSAVRQAGTVTQGAITLELIEGRRHASGTLTISGHPDEDRGRLAALVESLREVRGHLSDDPHLRYCADPHEVTTGNESRLPDATEATEEILDQLTGLDLVGIFASGAIHRGFASSRGRRLWHSTHPFNFDWSVYQEADRAVKSAYAGFDWDPGVLADKIGAARAQLEALARPARTIAPGRYRVYLAPAAVYEMLTMVGWGGFGLRAHETRTTPLLRMAEEGVCLHEAVSLAEHTAQGVAAGFQEAGFLRPGRVPLVDRGALAGRLVSPRSSVEYGAETNGASEHESPISWDMSGGEVPADSVLARLDTGIYVSNLWYLNFSDRVGGRITGMTRFATFWVENGEIQTPIDVMRFDETLYRMFGDNLAGLTDERDMILSTDTYGRRSVESARLPGALVDDFTLVA